MRRRSFASKGRLPKATAKPPARARVPCPPFTGRECAPPLFDFDSRLRLFQNAPQRGVGGVRRSGIRPCADPYATCAERGGGDSAPYQSAGRRGLRPLPINLVNPVLKNSSEDYFPPLSCVCSVVRNATEFLGRA